LFAKFSDDVFVSMERFIEGCVEDVITDVDDKFNTDDQVKHGGAVGASVADE